MALLPADTPRRPFAMQMTLTTRLDAPVQRVREELITTRLLAYVAAPLMRFKAIAPPRLPDIWGEDRYLVGLRFLGLLPLGRQWIVTSTEASNDGVFRLRDNGHGTLVKQWDHLITVEPLDDDHCRYTDQVSIEAGLLTPLAYLYARAFYAHRQRRWRKLIAEEFAGTTALAHIVA